MRVICLTFTYPKDAARAAYHQKFLPKDWRKIWCIESKDTGMSVPEGTETLVRDFPRGGSLRHGEAIEGMRRVYLELAEECDLLIKLDSDTALFRPEAFTAPAEFAGADFTYVRRFAAESRLLANGCCYAVSRRALLRLAQNFYPEGIPTRFEGHEDLIFSAFWAAYQRDLTLCQIDKTKWWWCCKPYRGSDVFGGHFGYVSPEQDRQECEAIFNANRSRAARS